MKTLLICGALLVLTGPALVSGLITVDDHCRSDQTCVFYGALGRPLYLQLPDENEFRLFNYSNTRLFRFKKPNFINNHPDPRWQFNTENRTLIITRAEKEDSGSYRLQTFSSAERESVYSLQLIIEAVVSSVKVTDSCISIGKRKVHCSSDGDQIQFSWTLNGIPHDQDLTDGNQTLLLDKRFTGSVSCHVKNHVSIGSDTVKIEPCPEPTTLTPSTNQTTSASSTSTNGTSTAVSTNVSTTVSTTVSTKVSPPVTDIGNLLYLTLIVLGLFTVLLIVVSVIACHIYRKKQAPKNTGSPQNGEELLYVQVNHKPKPKDGEDRTNIPAQVQEEGVEYASVVRKPKQKQKKNKEQKEEEVQYGEVVFNTPGKQRQEQAEEECVYSQVQHKR